MSADDRMERLSLWKGGLPHSAYFKELPILRAFFICKMSRATVFAPSLRHACFIFGQNSRCQELIRDDTRCLLVEMDALNWMWILIPFLYRIHSARRGASSYCTDIVFLDSAHFRLLHHQLRINFSSIFAIYWLQFSMGTFYDVDQDARSSY